MYKKLSILFFTLFVGASSVLAFSDLDESDKYLVPVEFLQERGIIQGYPDGTFQAEKSLNRAELTKIVLLSLDLEVPEVSEEDLCFPDLKMEDWFKDYVCAAKEFGWIQGYPDGTFQGSKTINHAEALKIIALASEWDLEATETDFSDLKEDDWFRAYVVQAEAYNFLPFKGEFDPGTEMTRGDFSEIYYRIVYSLENGLEVFEAPEGFEIVEERDIPEIEEFEVSETAQAQGDFYGEDVFDRITLESEFPETFLENEVYYFTGDLDAQAENIYVVMFPVGQQEDMKVKTYSINSDEFSVPVYFKEAGDYYLGITDKANQDIVIANVEVIADFEETSELISVSALSGLGMDFDGLSTSLSFTENADLKKLRFEQGSETVEYISRQTRDHLAVDYVDFVDFSEANVQVQVATASFDDTLFQRSVWTNSSSFSFSAVTHHYSEVDEVISNLQVNNFYTLGDTHTLSGHTSEDLVPLMSVILPDGQVAEYEDGPSISANSNFSFVMDSLEMGGTYILEVNKLTGIAAINYPIYEEGYIPLLPDYFDLNPLEYQEVDFDEESEKALMLDLINQARTDFGLNELRLDTDLSALAKEHAIDMIQNDFFAHVNLEGISPSGRAYLYGINMYVGENLANSISTEYSHEALMRSAIHRDNILHKDWTKVGISVLKDENGQYYAVQEFSTDLTYYYNELVAHVDSEADMETRDDLAQVAETWNNIMLEEGFFDTSNGTYDIGDYLNDLDYSDYRVIILSGIGVDNFKESLVEEINWDYYGMSLGFDERVWSEVLDLGPDEDLSEGLIKLTILYAR